MKRLFLLIILGSIGAAACSGSNLDGSTRGIPAQITVTPNSGRAVQPTGKQHSSFAPTANPGQSSYRRITVSIKSGGSGFSFPSYGGFKGNGYYARNNAQYGATLQITNSGTNDVLGAPAVSVASPVVLYFEVQLGGGASSATFSGTAKTMQLTSAQLQAGATYAIAAFSWNQRIEYYTAGQAVNGTLTFQTPLSRLTLYYYTPICIELVMVSPPTPSPSPTPTAYPQTLYGSYEDPTYGGVYSFDGDNFGSGPTNFTAMPNAFAAAVDDLQNLYVSSSKGSVLEYYPAGGTFTYDNDVSNPMDVAVHAGNNPVVNVANGSGVSNYAQLLTFPQGVDQASPLTDPNLISIQSVAVDAAGNTYVGGVSNQNGPEVDLLGASGGWIRTLGLQLTGAPRGLALDQMGNLVVAESQRVAIFVPGQTTPSSWIGSYGQTPFALSFGNAGNWLYVLYNTGPCYGSCVDVYTYPAGTSLGQYTLPGSANHYGVALSPRVPLFNPNVMRRLHPHRKYWTDFVRGRIRQWQGSPIPLRP